MTGLFVLLFSVACGPKVVRMPGSTKSLGRPRVVQRNIPAAEPASESKERSFSKPKKGEQIALAAEDFLGDKSLTVDGNNYRYDCSGFVMAVYAEADIPINGSTKMLYELSKEKGVLHRRKIPNVGEVVFFDNSHDRNKNGKRDDDLTHIAVVEKVDSDGTITLIHLGGSGIVRTYMNLRRADVHKSPEGKVLNSYLRVANRKDPGPRLTGELWRAFGALYSIPGYELEG